MAPQLAPDFCQPGQLLRLRGEEGASTSRRAPRVKPDPEAIGAYGASPFAPLPSLRSQAERALGPGLLSMFWDRGYPDLPTCGPPRDFIDGPATRTHSQDPREGLRPHEANDTKTSQGESPRASLPRSGTLCRYPASRGSR
jgi:hypothetical protein